MAYDMDSIFICKKDLQIKFESLIEGADIEALVNNLDNRIQVVRQNSIMSCGMTVFEAFQNGFALALRWVYDKSDKIFVLAHPNDDDTIYLITAKDEDDLIKTIKQGIE